MGKVVMTMQSEPVWQREVVLPIGYQDEQSGRLYKQATLRKMTGKEEALLADPALRSNGGALITALLANCITQIESLTKVDSGMTRNLFSGDRNFLLLELRRLTFGDNMEAHYRCPHCQKIVAVEENLSTIPVRSIANGMVPVMEVTLRDGYRDVEDNWQYEFVFGLPTGADEEAASSRRDNNPTRQRDALLARCLKQVGNLESKRVEAMGTRILADLSMPDRNRIRNAIDANAPGPDLNRTINCPSCGGVFNAPLDMSRFFFAA